MPYNVYEVNFQDGGKNEKILTILLVALIQLQCSVVVLKKNLKK